MSQPVRVLFLCVANSARSLMAEALLRQAGGADYQVFSAGSQPGQPDPRALQALAAERVPVDGLYSKSITSLAGEHFDCVITLCDQQALECATLPAGDAYLAWHFEDPAASGHPAAFAQTLQALRERIRLFLLMRGGEAAVSALTPPQLFRTLADETRSRICLLIAAHGELCVCELTAALQESQPKVSRHLAQLRSSGLLEDRRQGQWVYYRLHPQLPHWVHQMLVPVLAASRSWLAADEQRLLAMGNRPERTAACQ